jgi:hypothetical protein
MKLTTPSKIIMLLAIILLIVLYFWRKSAVKSEEMSKLYTTSLDSMKSFRNQKGEFISTISVLQASKNSYFLELKTKDSAINHLQDIVKQEQKKNHDVNVALTFYTTTYHHLKDSLKNTIVASDTETIHGVKYIYPTYTHELKDSGNWISGNVIMGRQTFDYTAKFRNDFDIIIGDESAGLFKRKPFAQITDLNPHTSTQNMKVYQKTTTPNKPLINFLEGTALGAVIVLLVKIL